MCPLSAAPAQHPEELPPVELVQCLEQPGHKLGAAAHL